MVGVINMGTCFIASLTCRPIRANIERTNDVKMITSARFLTEKMIALTIFFRPGITATDFKARKTLNVLRAPNWPKSTTRVMYDIPTTTKSSQFHGSLR